MKQDILIVGVGGQGTVLASRILAQTAINNGLFARTAETIGMAQRGGCVVSHVRIGDAGAAPVIPVKGADVIIGFEPYEAVRNFPYLKPGGAAIVAAKAIKPVTASLQAGSDDLPRMLAFLTAHIDRLILVDSDKLCLEADNFKALNVIMLGIAIREGYFAFSADSILQTIKQNLSAKLWQTNGKALQIGLDYTQFGGRIAL